MWSAAEERRRASQFLCHLGRPVKYPEAQERQSAGLAATAAYQWQRFGLLLVGLEGQRSPAQLQNLQVGYVPRRVVASLPEEIG